MGSATDTGKLRIVPLGGLGEIGKNTMVIQYEEEIIIVDAGMAFPDEEMLGVDVVIPDYSYLLERRDKVRAVVLTHGHEDHVGGLPYLLKEIDCPVYGTRLTLALVERKLQDHGFSLDGRQKIVESGTDVQLGPFRVEFFRVLHSIADAVGLGIHTPVGIIVHSGDFKFDQTPVDNRPTDFHKLAELGSKGVLVLLSDSTNADRQGYTQSEQTVGKAFDRIFEDAGRILVACFASNVPRMLQVAAAAVRHDRHLAAIGRSMETVLEVAMELGYVNLPPGTLIAQDQIDSVAPEKLVILTTGTQGEPMSALTRMARSEHRLLTLNSSDTVIFSASAVPGNESMVNRTIDSLLRLGPRVIYQPRSGVHVSGHASQEELKLMINLVRPQYFIPIHGQFRHLREHAELAQSLGIPSDNILVGENGMVFTFTADSGEICGRVPAGNVLVDGLGVGDVGNAVLRDRHQLSEDGIVIVILNTSDGRLVRHPDLISRGFVYVRESEQLLSDARDLVSKLWDNSSAPRKSRVRDTLSRYLYERTGRRPMILPVFVENAADPEVITSQP